MPKTPASNSIKRNGNGGLVTGASIVNVYGNALGAFCNVYLVIAHGIFAGGQAIFAKLRTNNIAGKLGQNLPVQVIFKILQRVTGQARGRGFDVGVFKFVLGRGRALQPLVIKRIATEGRVFGFVHKILRQ